ncbi:hypothetical protein M9H77_07848 [Catharanthus roseus]|uniref:Uncharacterized protein n=1 Tax=Catharanthus roseus TaxID=4058 RepID=A0ACC0BW48_CATRO|nr:hypothetical protein M9H77_07848 [Catharanthus roseus]
MKSIENCEEINIMPFADVKEFNCDVINHSECIGDDSMLLECLEERTVVETSIEDSLVGSVVSSEADAFKLYNDMHSSWGLVFAREIKSSRPDPIFVGMDNHYRNVMFDCGFLKNEKTSSFIWLISS